jgi:uncharacterized coiled-coil protein SlyX
LKTEKEALEKEKETWDSQLAERDTKIKTLDATIIQKDKEIDKLKKTIREL